ncbi:sigma factor-like helix-turn-helix DNA-binding protein [Streptomyces sp. NPDC051020]|uniref:sigma factor-like helix-turn-helix DNA-binding protein n=1 Tax=Streptomyces sp. NPDC051020 TaxID=3155409 RepID=UPI003418A3C7
MTSYRQIAEACAVPVGTVRSRLSQARAVMARALTATAAAAHEDVMRRTEASWQDGLRNTRGRRARRVRQGGQGPPLPRRLTAGRR